jgi:hypothetical protein
MSKLEFLGIIFLKETRGPRAALVHGGPRSPSWGRLAGERPERRPRARNLTAVEEKWRWDGGEPHRLQEGVAEGQTFYSGQGGAHRGGEGETAGGNSLNAIDGRAN